MKTIIAICIFAYFATSYVYPQLRKFSVVDNVHRKVLWKSRLLIPDRFYTLWKDTGFIDEDEYRILKQKRNEQ